MENQRTNEDDSHSDPHPEAGIFRSQTTQNSGPEVGHDILTGVGSPNDPCPEVMISCQHSGKLNSSEVEEYPDMVTGVQEEICNRPHLVTEI